jgi:nitronate monooxygenase
MVLGVAFDQHHRVDQALSAGLRVVSLFWGDPQSYVDSVHDAGGLVMHTVGSVEEARRAVGSGVDIVVAQGQGPAERRQVQRGVRVDVHRLVQRRDEAASGRRASAISLEEEPWITLLESGAWTRTGSAIPTELRATRRLALSHRPTSRLDQTG